MQLTIIEAVKDTEGTLKERIARIVRKYNRTYHSAIKCTLVKEWEKEEKIAMNNYAGRFRKGKKEVFTVGVEIRVSQRENIKEKSKELKGRFFKKGKI
jgi:DNA-binding transcriptional regulator YbjK